MKILKHALSVALISSAFFVSAGELTLKANDGFDLKADYFASKTKSERAVLMLHQCNYNRSMYDKVGKKLAKHGLHALSLDFRGYGESINEEYNFAELQSLPQDERRKAWQKMAADWPKDVIVAYKFLRDKVGEKGKVGVIGASCGGSQAITLSERFPVDAVSFFSSGQREQNIERYKKSMADKPSLIIASEQDGGTYTSAVSLFKAAKHDKSRFIAYKGSEHGYPLYKKDSSLAKTIASWFDQQL